MSRRSKTAERDSDPKPPEAKTPEVETEETGEDIVAADPYDKLEGQSVNEAIRGGMGGGDNYPYLDKTAAPLHERDLPMNSDAAGPSQADLNPAFSAKPEDGGRSKEKDGEQVIEGTEPNVNDKALAAAESTGDDEAVQAVKDSVQAGQDAQMDVDEVNAKGEQRAPEGTFLGGDIGEASGDGADTEKPGK